MDLSDIAVQPGRGPAAHPDSGSGRRARSPIGGPPPCRLENIQPGPRQGRCSGGPGGLRRKPRAGSPTENRRIGRPYDQMASHRHAAVEQGSEGCAPLQRHPLGRQPAAARSDRRRGNRGGDTSGAAGAGRPRGRGDQARSAAGRGDGHRQGRSALPRRPVRRADDDSAVLRGPGGCASVFRAATGTFARRY